MAELIDEDDKEYSDLATVISQRNDLAPEEFPDGPYGSIVNPIEQGTSLDVDQHSPNPFGYENRQMHEEPRHYPGDHELHDSGEEEERMD